MVKLLSETLLASWLKRFSRLGVDEVDELMEADLLDHFGGFFLKIALEAEKRD